MDKELEDVRAFHKKFDILNNDHPTMVTKRKLQERIECMQEELDEFRKAVEEQDFEEQADALVDLVYFAKGTAVMMGLPWGELWDDVQRANMTKVRGVGKRGHAVDMVKPEGWQKPMTGLILQTAGFDKTQFMNEAREIDEHLCADDEQRILFTKIKNELSKRGARLGDDMTGPVNVIRDGKLVPLNTTTEVNPEDVVAANSFRLEFDEHEGCIIPILDKTIDTLMQYSDAGYTLHLYQAHIDRPSFGVGEPFTFFEKGSMNRVQRPATAEDVTNNIFVCIRVGLGGNKHSREPHFTNTDNPIDFPKGN